MSPRFVLAGLLAALFALFPTQARAYEEQWHFGGGFGVASFVRSDAALAPLIGAHAAYDVSDIFDLRVELLAAEHEFIPGEPTHFYSAAAGIVYKLDVLEWVPYVGILGGYYALDGPTWPSPLKQRELGVSIPLGLDYTFSRTFGMGAQIRYHGFMSDPMSSLSDAPYFTALLRAEYRAGW